MRVRAFLAYLLATLLAATGLSIGGGLAPALAVDPVPVTGMVVDAGTGTGIPAADVEAEGELSYETAVTNSSGSYGMSLPPGTYTLYAWADGYEDAFLTVDITTTTTTLPDLELQPLPDPVTVTGRVLDDTTGAGVVGADVWAEGDGFAEAVTGASGTYTLSLRPGFYALGASSPDYYDAAIDVEVTATTTTLPDLRLEPVPPGILVEVENSTFGGPVEGVGVVLQPASGAATQASTDANGEAFFPAPAHGQYTVDIVPGAGFLQDGDPVAVDYAGGLETVFFGVSVDLSCEPATANASLTNMGFESGLTGWKLGYQTESIQAVPADGFASPWEGTQMARVGESKPSSSEDQPEGPNVMCQDFVVTDPEEAFAFNVFTYDYTGFDEFRFDVVVSSPDTGETIAAYQQGAWGEGTQLKTSGWRGVQLDLSGHVGDTVRLSFRAGGTSDSAYAFWVYLDSAQTLPPTITLPTTAVQTESGSVTTDPVTGQVVVSMPTGDPSDVTLTVPAECSDPEVPPSAVSLLLNGQEFPATSVGDGKYKVTIPESSVQSGTLSLQVVCPGETTLVLPIGQIVLYDPSGIVSDAATGAPVVGAEVRLFKVPGWTPQGDTGPYPADSCQTNLSKDAGAPWSQPAPTGLGELVNAASPEISPNVNPFITNNVGYYGWDVAEGCWYVEVSKAGYKTLVSPVVGVPTAVTDLHLKLERLVVTNTSVPTISGAPRVGETLTASPGTWSEAAVSLTYQWRREGTPIAGAAAPTYTVTTEDVGKAISVQVTASKQGYQSGVAVSAPVTGEATPVPAPTTAPAPTTGPGSPACATAKTTLAQATVEVTEAQAAVALAKKKVKKLKKALKAAISKAKSDPGNDQLALKVKKLKKKLKKAKAALRKAQARLATAVAAKTAAAAKVTELC